MSIHNLTKILELHMMEYQIQDGMIVALCECTHLNGSTMGEWSVIRGYSELMEWLGY